MQVFRGRSAIKELLNDVERWRGEGVPIALARVVRTGGSTPRDPGAAMAVTEDGRVAGSVSGGCVEGAVVLEALDVLASGRGRVVRFGYTDDEAFAVGLTCGGEIDILVTGGLPEGFEELSESLRAQEPLVLATVAASPDRVGAPAVGSSMLVRSDGAATGSLGEANLDRAVERDARGALSAGRSELRSYSAEGELRGDEVRVFYEVFAPPPRMVIFGATDFTTALARVAKVLGYYVIVCDARETFTTRARFPMADEVVVDWPERYLAEHGHELTSRDACCVLTHDPKFDVPAVVAALQSDVGYLGAMGSRKSHATRLERLREAGVAEQALRRVMAPIGLDIGARSPEETAISILAEVIALSSGSIATSLRDSSGPIHRDRASAAQR